MKTTAGRVIVVDDEKDFADNVALLLREEGYDAVACGSGPELLERMKSETPALIILDIMMPAMTGLAALAELRKSANGGAVPVLLFSASREPAGVEKTWQEFLPKPFDIDELVRRVKRLCP
ncbi:MAG: response regulator [Proteobacteria bacterium]|nr:MAG: response regulator [Pseudomonadota bacterium]